VWASTSTYNVDHPRGPCPSPYLAAALEQLNLVSYDTYEPSAPATVINKLSKSAAPTKLTTVSQVIPATVGYESAISCANSAVKRSWHHHCDESSLPNGIAKLSQLDRHINLKILGI
jgi:hypothetical protein